MKKQLDEEQFDRFMQTLLDDASADESVVDDIAGSPTLWWAVQREIGKQKELNASPWPPVGKYWRWVVIGLPAAAALLIAFFVFRPAGTPVTVADGGAAGSRSGSRQEIANPAREVTNTPAGPGVVAQVPAPTVVSTKPTEPIRKAIAQPTLAHAIQPRSERPAWSTTTKTKTEIKTEFIALSYARNPESGQIVRVRVPSSMMVTVGLVSSVEKPSALVDAEVIVGDDGLTRAIRFIR